MKLIMIMILFSITASFASEMVNQSFYISKGHVCKSLEELSWDLKSKRLQIGKNIYRAGKSCTQYMSKDCTTVTFVKNTVTLTFDSFDLQSCNRFGRNCVNWNKIYKYTFSNDGKSYHLFQTGVPALIHTGECDYEKLPEPVIDHTDVKISKLNYTFVRDERYPQLGRAYRDQRGIIWGELTKVNGKPIDVENLEEAKANCASLGARLPSVMELRHLGAMVAYQGTTIDGSSEVLPDLDKVFSFWTMTGGYFFEAGYRVSPMSILRSDTNWFTGNRCVMESNQQ